QNTDGACEAHFPSTSMRTRARDVPVGVELRVVLRGHHDNRRQSHRCTVTRHRRADRLTNYTRSCIARLASANKSSLGVERSLPPSRSLLAEVLARGGIHQSH